MYFPQQELWVFYVENLNVFIFVNAPLVGVVSEIMLCFLQELAENGELEQMLPRSEDLDTR